MENNTQSPLLRLPLEVLCEIFSRVTDTQEKLNLRTVCKAFRQIVDDKRSWKNVSKVDIFANKTFMNYVEINNFPVTPFSIDHPVVTYYLDKLLYARHLQFDAYAQEMEENDQLMPMFLKMKFCNLLSYKTMGVGDLCTRSMHMGELIGRNNRTLETVDIFYGTLEKKMRCIASELIQVLPECKKLKKCVLTVTMSTNLAEAEGKADNSDDCHRLYETLRLCPNLEYLHFNVVHSGGGAPLSWLTNWTTEQMKAWTMMKTFTCDTAFDCNQLVFPSEECVTFLGHLINCRLSLTNLSPAATTHVTENMIRYMSPCAEIIELNDKARLPNVTKPMDLNELKTFIMAWLHKMSSAVNVPPNQMLTLRAHLHTFAGNTTAWVDQANAAVADINRDHSQYEISLVETDTQQQPFAIFLCGTHRFKWQMLERVQQ